MRPSLRASTSFPKVIPLSRGASAVPGTFVRTCAQESQGSLAGSRTDFVMTRATLKGRSSLHPHVAAADGQPGRSRQFCTAEPEMDRGFWRTCALTHAHSSHERV